MLPIHRGESRPIIARTLPGQTVSPLQYNRTMEDMPYHGADFANIILDSPARQLDRPFTYAIPDHLKGKVEVGSAVIVPFLHNYKIGFVLEFCEAPQVERIKEIHRVINEPPIFDQETVELCKWIAERYITPLAQVFRLVIPPGRTHHLMEKVTLKRAGEDFGSLIPRRSSLQREILTILSEGGGSIEIHTLKSRFAEKNINLALKRLEEGGWIERELYLARPAVSRLEVATIVLEKAGNEVLDRTNENKERNAELTSLQLQTLMRLLERGGKLPQAELRHLTGISYSSLRSMAKRGLISILQEERLRDPFSHRTFDKPVEVTLNQEQQDALQAITKLISEGRHEVILLHGITGSGKTEVYLRAIRYALEREKTAIVLVPEISLTPQMVERFKGSLGERVAVLHSRLSPGERYDQWRGIRNGEHRVVIGARSALFAPLKNLGLIIIDEEHETSYKEHTAPRYHARDVALHRARLNQAVLVLGSATPQLETLWRARKGEYGYLKLSRRIDNRPLPRIEVVDMRGLSAPGFKTILSPKLINALIAVYEAGEQAILFLNRRGFAHYLQCYQCGYIFRCSDCSVSLCFHLQEERLLCHHCNQSLLPPFICPGCGNQDFRFAGVGTERVEEELRRLLPPLTCLRMDADTTTRKHAHWEILDQFKARKAHVLLGTQMIAKGLDIPTVTLVGVINADTSLALPDFRAAERTFQLLTQVSGRAGRGNRPGRVIIQTFAPENYAIAACLHGDSEEFYRKELSFRKEAGYPPFSHVINLIFSSPQEDAALELSRAMVELLRNSSTDSKMQLLGPAPAPLSRLKGRFRYHLLIKTTDLKGAGEGIEKVLPDLEKFRLALCRGKKLSKEDLNIIIDVDPVSLL